MAASSRFATVSEDDFRVEMFFFPLFWNNHLCIYTKTIIRLRVSDYQWIFTSTSSRWIYNNYSMSPSWIWSAKITNERVARFRYNHFISNKGSWNNCYIFTDNHWPCFATVSEDDFRVEMFFFSLFWNNHLTVYFILKQLFASGSVIIGEYSPRLRLGEYITIIPWARAGYEVIKQ